MLARFDRERREEFVESKADLDAKYEALPAPLKARIDRFRAERDDFRIDGEAYEMAAVADAPKIARALAEQHGWTLTGDCAAPGVSRDDIEAAIKDYWNLPYKEQTRLVPNLDPGHSGNTFGGACRLAAGLLAGRGL